jgi:CheY-like chemotaxis protein
VVSSLVAHGLEHTTIGQVRVDVVQSGGLVRIAVEDTGVGIPQESLEDVFEPVVHVARSKDAGLGLAIVRLLVERMGGSIRVESSVGHGSRFEILLPLEMAGADDTTPKDEPDTISRDGPTLRVLLAEDDVDLAAVLAEVVRSLGHEVVVAADGYAAVRAAQAQDFDVVVMDVHLPGIDGLEATRRLHADPKLRNLPVIALTASVDAEQRARCLGAGMVDVLGKPIRRGQLQRRLAAVNRRMSPAELAARTATRTSPVQAASTSPDHAARTVPE